MECQNILILDKFRCDLDPDHRICKKIHWTECRNLQAKRRLEKDFAEAVAALKKKDDWSLEVSELKKISGILNQLLSRFRKRGKELNRHVSPSTLLAKSI